MKGFRFHDLRHTFATHLVQAGADIYPVHRHERWKTLQMVMRYARQNPESLCAGSSYLTGFRQELHSEHTRLIGPLNRLPENPL